MALPSVLRQEASLTMSLSPRRALFVVPLLLCLLVALTLRDGARAGSATTISILFDTHFHGNLTGTNDVTFANYAGLIAARRAASPYSLWVGAGDDLASSQFSSVFKGRHMVDAFNVAGLDVDTVGNHEFDYGPENFLTQVRASRFAWVSANVRDRRTGGAFGAEAGVRPYVIRELGPVRVGITGAAWEFLGSTSAGPNVEVLPAARALATVVPQMRAEGAQVVLVLSHMCIDEMRAVAAAVGGIDAILGDHCGFRIAQPERVGNTLIGRRGDEYQALGELQLTVEGGRVAGSNYIEHEVTKDSPKLAAIEALIADYQGQLSAELQVRVGETTVSLDARNSTVRERESNLGNYIADELRSWGKADAALQNGGGIRGNREYGPGVLTRGDLVSILPFNNTAVVLRITGANLRAALENGVSQAGTGAGRFPQISGMTFRFDPAAAPGSRILSVTVGGAPLDPARTYTLATNDFLANGGDGYDAFKTGEVVIGAQAGPLLTDLLVDAITRERTISPGVDGRISTGP